MAFLTGVLAYALGTPRSWWVAAAHGAAGLAILLLAPWKSLIVRRGMKRSRPGRGASLGLFALVAISIASGLLHSAAVPRIGGVTTMQVHVGTALVALPLAAWHVIARPARPHRTDLSRRRMLAASLLVVGAAGAYGVTEALKIIGLIPGGSRRFTGSHQEAYFRPEEMPVTQWLFDQVPEVDPETWTLTVKEGSRSTAFSYQDLLAFDDKVRTILDCTGGWYAEQDWRGVILERLLTDIPSRSVTVVSVTGYLRRFPRRDAARMLLATSVGGRPLSSGHGFPLRLVVPGRRGFWWVKWIAEVRAGDEPWWWQPPFPLR